MAWFIVEGPTTVLGGLPVWAVFTYSRGDGWETDDDFDLDALHWLKSDGSKGGVVPEHIVQRAEGQDMYFCDAFEQLSANLTPPPDPEAYVELTTPAQAMEARSAETTGSARKGDSAVHAPKTPIQDHQND